MKSGKLNLTQAVTFVATIATLIAGVSTWYSTSEQAAVNQRQADIAQQGQVTDRFTKAVDQLAKPELETRLGGIYALERIARDSERDQPSVMEVLTAFVRERSKQAPAPNCVTPEVQAAVTVIARRMVERDSNPIDLSEACLAGADLTDANLTGADLTEANLTDADLTDAQLADAHLIDADLTGAQLIDAHLNSTQLADACITGTRLNGADLTDANLSRADLYGARLYGAHFHGASLYYVHLEGAHFTDTDLNGADLHEADLTASTCDRTAAQPLDFTDRALRVFGD